jgi:hypothetical protein
VAIDISDLLPGDLVFPYTGIDLSLPGTNAVHAMMVGPADELGIATQIHQVGNGMMAPPPQAGSQRERLIPNTLKKDGESSSRKRIMRCRNEALRQRAAELASHWQSEYKLAFSDSRRDNGVQFESKHDAAADKPDILVAKLQEKFRQTGRFRAIKYATRRNGFLSYPGEAGAGNGMYCSMFVAICYQVAGLNDVVRAASINERMTRVSDKKMSEKDLAAVAKQMKKGKFSCQPSDFNAYARYTLALNERNHYDLKDYEAGPASPKLKTIDYEPSLMYWNFDVAPSIDAFKWESNITKGMMIDAKIVMPRGLYFSLLADQDGWKDMGDLVGAQHFEKPEDTRARAEARHSAALDRQKAWLNKRVKF